MKTENLTGSSPCRVLASPKQNETNQTQSGTFLSITRDLEAADAATKFYRAALPAGLIAEKMELKIQTKHIQIRRQEAGNSPIYIVFLQEIDNALNLRIPPKHGNGLLGLCDDGH